MHRLVGWEVCSSPNGNYNGIAAAAINIDHTQAPTTHKHTSHTSSHHTQAQARVTHAAGQICSSDISRSEMRRLVCRQSIDCFSRWLSFLWNFEMSSCKHSKLFHFKCYILVQRPCLLSEDHLLRLFVCIHHWQWLQSKQKSCLNVNIPISVIVSVLEPSPSHYCLFTSTAS